eukprot:8717530-Pyramimonas_sp.AAC.1
MQLRVQGRSSLMAVVYATGSVGTEAKAPKLANVGTLVSAIQRPWLATGGWSMTAHELAST